jgi:hypothetical protein
LPLRPTHLGPADDPVVAAGALENDSRFDPSLLFKTVFIRDRRVFFLSPGTSGPAFADELMFAIPTRPSLIPIVFFEPR